MRIMLATLCLNGMEWLEKLVEQHIEWPGLAGWVFVEAADRVYADTNPEMVTSEGLSVDGTTEFLERLQESAARKRGWYDVHHIRHGFTTAANPAQGKCEARTAYLRVADWIEPDFVIVVDDDELYTREHQAEINRRLDAISHTAVLLRQRFIWRPPSIAHEPLFGLEAVGGYTDVPHCRIWRWSRGLAYKTNHNTPESPDGRLLTRAMKRYDAEPGAPECVHMAFASSLADRKATHAYYRARGEGPSDGRQRYVDFRAAYETWTPDDELPGGAKVIDYTGPVPEVFR